MGLFLTLSSVISKPAKEVENALRNYLKTVDGGLERASIDYNHKNFCVIQSNDKNTTIVYPPYFLKWDECAIFLSKELNAPVFVLHIYDGDFWSYTLFVDEEIRDAFMPIPDYFDENISEEEIDKVKGNAVILSNYISGLNPKNIERYLVRWNLDEDEIKAYEDDEFTNCEYQLFDFMKKLRLPYQTDENDVAVGEVFRFWSKDLPLVATEAGHFDGDKSSVQTKPWWKFW